MADIRREGKKLLPSEIALLQAEAEGWRPEKGEQIDGVVLGVKVGTSTFGEYPIVFILTKDGNPVAVHAFHTTLQNELISSRPERGDAIFVAYLGPKENWEGPKGYDPPEIYAVAVTKPDGKPADPWARFAPAPTTPPSAAKDSEFSDPAPF
jgi:hypothetical protein